MIISVTSPKSRPHVAVSHNTLRTITTALWRDRLELFVRSIPKCKIISPTGSRYVNIKQFSKKQYQSNYSDQSQHGQTARWIKQNSQACSLLKTREKSRMQGAIGFAAHWLKNWREMSQPIANRSNPNRVITFDSRFKTVLYVFLIAVQWSSH